MYEIATHVAIAMPSFQLFRRGRPLGIVFLLAKIDDHPVAVDCFIRIGYIHDEADFQQGGAGGAGGAGGVSAHFQVFFSGSTRSAPPVRSQIAAQALGAKVVTSSLR